MKGIIKPMHILLLMIYGNAVSVLGEYINTTKKNREAISDTNKEVYLQIYADIFRYVLMFHHQNAVQNHATKTANK
jgi:hypothetical protein